MTVEVDYYWDNKEISFNDATFGIILVCIYFIPVKASCTVAVS